MRLVASIKQGTVTASLILRKLAAYLRQNSLAMGLRKYDRVEPTIFTLKWLRDPPLRRRVTGGLNKGEAPNPLARTVFFHRLGEIRDRSYENQPYRASGLNLVIATITLWNTVYFERAVAALREQGLRRARRSYRFMKGLYRFGVSDARGRWKSTHMPMRIRRARVGSPGRYGPRSVRTGKRLKSGGQKQRRARTDLNGTLLAAQLLPGISEHQSDTVLSRIAAGACACSIGAKSGSRVRAYWRGEQPMTRRKATLKALSDSYPSE